MRPGGRTRPLRCFAIRGLSSDSRALRDVEVIRSSISSLVSMALLHGCMISFSWACITYIVVWLEYWQSREFGVKKFHFLQQENKMK